MSRLLAALIAAALALAAGGCGVGPGESQGGDGVELRVTRDFGQEQLGAPKRASEVRESDTVMRFLQGARRVRTRYGGAFVQSIDGLAGNAGSEHDWFYYVNGSEASVGAADYSLSSGDVVQWDYHDWHATQHVPAIVGAYPEPFLHGLKGKKLPTRVECEDDSSAACRAVLDKLGDLGVKASSAPLGAPTSSEGTVRVVVAKFEVASQVRGAAQLEAGPATSGVYAKFSGESLQLLDPAGHVAQTAPPGSGLVAATQPPAQAITWLVTGADDAGVERAAEALDARKLSGAFAVAATPAGVVKLPVPGAGS